MIITIRLYKKNMFERLEMKVAIMTDDNSGMTREEAAGLGIFIMPMPFL